MSDPNEVNTLTDLPETDSDGLLWMNRGDVDAQIGARRVSDYCNDDTGELGANDDIVNTMLAKTEQKICSILLNSFTLDEIVTIMNTDQYCRSLSGDVAAELMSRRKGDFASEDGKGRHFQAYKEAIDHFKSMSHGRANTTTPGVNNVQQGGTQLPTKVPSDSPTFTFAPEVGFRGGGRGGF